MPIYISDRSDSRYLSVCLSELPVCILTKWSPLLCRDKVITSLLCRNNTNRSCYGFDGRPTLSQRTRKQSYNVFPGNVRGHTTVMAGSMNGITRKPQNNTRRSCVDLPIHLPDIHIWHGFTQYVAVNTTPVCIDRIYAPGEHNFRKNDRLSAASSVKTTNYYVVCSKN